MMAYFEVKVRIFATKRVRVEAENLEDMETIAIDKMKAVPKGQLIPEFDIMEWRRISAKEYEILKNANAELASAVKLQQEEFQLTRMYQKLPKQ
jgi:hypothetical protein